jgi:hypothetical protein
MLGRTITTMEEISRLDDIIKPAMEMDSSTSKTSTSYVKRLSTLPNGVVSKYDEGARRTRVVMSKNIRSAHLAPPATGKVDSEVHTPYK